jgi:hypothetical protein
MICTWRIFTYHIPVVQEAFCGDSVLPVPELAAGSTGLDIPQVSPEHAKQRVSF